jgi:hypothetical protein
MVASSTLDDVARVRRALAVLPDNAAGDILDTDVQEHVVVRADAEVLFHFGCDSGSILSHNANFPPQRVEQLERPRRFDHWSDAISVHRRLFGTRERMPRIERHFCEAPRP